jgi:predicted component of type VI protein secretion system
MGFLTRLEKLSEKYIEGFFKNKFAAHIQPAEIAKLLLREMRDNKNVSVSKVYVPNEYTVLLSQADWETIDSVHHSISGELQVYLKQKAVDKGYEMAGVVKVTFEQGEDLPMGTVYVKTHFSEQIPQEPPEVTEHLAESAEGPNQSTLIAEKARFYNSMPVLQTQGTLTKLNAQPLPTAVLVTKIGTKDGVKFPLGRRGVIIGRRRTSDIRIEDTNVSRVHASIDCVGEEYFLTDLGSTNGTYVNGARINKKKLVAGDLVRIGTTILEFKVV